MQSVQECVRYGMKILLKLQQRRMKTTVKGLSDWPLEEIYFKKSSDDMI